MALPLSQALAVDSAVDGLASFRVVLVLTPGNDLDFAPGADVEFSGTPDASTVNIATNGDRTLTGTFFSESDVGVGQAGEVGIAGTTGESVTIGCDSSSEIQKTGGKKLNITSIRVSTAANGANLAGGSACAGVGSTATTLTLAGSDHLLLGGTIIATSGDGVEAGDYSTALASDPIAVRVIYQ